MSHSRSINEKENAKTKIGWKHVQVTPPICLAEQHSVFNMIKQSHGHQPEQTMMDTEKKTKGNEWLKKEGQALISQIQTWNQECQT